MLLYMLTNPSIIFRNIIVNSSSFWCFDLTYFLYLNLCVTGTFNCFDILFREGWFKPDSLSLYFGGTRLNFRPQLWPFWHFSYLSSVTKSCCGNTALTCAIILASFQFSTHNHPRNIMLDIAHRLRCIWSIWRFGSWLYSWIQVIGCHDTGTYYYFFFFSFHRFFLVLFLLNQWWTSPLRLQVSVCSTFLIICDFLSTAVFCR
jgi:hypothetical protein